ncbi:ATP-dependent DNA helicase [Roseospirillum parvum]|uniref:ATP-dependent DNA helicase DinG n=1 Tax=Roseospirillum parvum TaxID=83401 RepID=A0A1G8BDC1_9PROT|nr:ATP-dependent DNA helicase [Roseospirillum parvum]SDH31199.1 ATP-dependent DNA helicase DinG [Roseospirillum parvum]
MTPSPPAPTPAPGRRRLPDAPVLAVGLTHGVLVWPGGEVEDLRPGPAAGRRLKNLTPILCHRQMAARRLKVDPFPAHDLLELFAFVHPARFAAPTPRGLARALALPLPPDDDLGEQALSLVEATRTLLDSLIALPPAAHREALGCLWPPAWAGWSWAGPVGAALGAPDEVPHSSALTRGLRIWERLPEVGEHAPPPPPGAHPVPPEAAADRLADLLGPDAESRPQQVAYAEAACHAFAPRDREDEPRVLLAEAGTGVGKTLGYIAPASLWAEANQGAVWISTYTRNLQRQLDGELDRLCPDPVEKARRVVVRKGRENYLCLLNLEEAVRRLPMSPQSALGLTLIARWARASRDGDMVAGDLPGWLIPLLGGRPLMELADRRGECIHAACPHYNRCLVERAVRRARRADLVVANHALVLVQAALGGLDGEAPPRRYVFDEGHHLFAAADSAFAAHLSGQETAELRRWLRGAEADTTRSRARGLKRRAEDLMVAADGADHGPAADALAQALAAARVLPGPGWGARLAGDAPDGATEHFLTLVRRQVYARAPNADSPHDLECETTPPIPGLIAAATELAAGLDGLIAPLTALVRLLRRTLAQQPGETPREDPGTAPWESPREPPEAALRQRLEALIRSLERRALMPLQAWRDMLAALSAPQPARFVDWMAVNRLEGRDIDVGLHRHWLDPTEPLAREVLTPAHGVLITSATLRDGSGDPQADWAAAEARTGIPHLPAAVTGAPDGPTGTVRRAALASPFDYPERTRVIVVTDVRKDDLDQVAAAYRALFLAADGGGLGLFTAISRLRGVHARLTAPLEAAGLTLYAQHVDALDPATLVDIFRAEERACLLGTDALRDGVDVPGNALRLVVFDRVPWPRPDILHKARRAALPEAAQRRAHDDMITRLRLKQAFGRLIRRHDDRGVFVLLDPMMPSRLFGAFPEGVTPERLSLAEATRLTSDFLAP